MQKALEPLILSWRVPELRNRMLYVLGMMVIYVFALWVPIPNVDQAKLKVMFENSGGILDFIDIFGGGALRRLSILALGIMPYITASIVFQILTMVLPAIKELQQEGEYGRRKIAQWTRWAAIALTLVQAIIAARAFMNPSIGVLPDTPLNFFQTVIALTAGTMFLIWMGERITEKGVGNGISFIIFAGIVARAPEQMVQLAQEVAFWQVLLLIGLLVGTIWYILKVTQGERRIPVKYPPRQAGRGRMIQGQRSHLPLKMAAAGVIPIIFAISIVLFPGQIAQFYLKSLPANYTGAGFNVAVTISNLFAPGSVLASLLYAALVMGFTYFYTAAIFDVRDVADNLKRYGGQVPGYAPGRATYLYINRVLTRITFAGGLFLASVALLQWWAPTILQLPTTVGATGISTLIGGTSILIVVGVTLEIMTNLDQQLKMRQYEGLVKQMEKGKL